MLSPLKTLAVLCCCGSLTAQAAPHFQVVIDPGHGGSDEGTVAYHGTMRVTEKDLTLTLAHQIAGYLRRRGVRVTLTRTQDRELSLASRTALANHLKADVFLSIHLNSTTGPRIDVAEGTETYILNTASDATSRKLARMENAVFTAYETGKSDVAVILKDLRLGSNLAQSKLLACLVQNTTAEPGRNRGVKQALFHVLLGADMPSVLLEAGFLSSTRDRARILSYEGQRRMTRSVAEAILKYKQTRGTRLASVLVSNCQVRGQ